MSNKPGAPISSAKPVFGKAVDVTITVCVETTICVNAAPTVPVAGFDVGEAVAVAWAMTGVFVGGTVFVTAAVLVSACTAEVAVSPAWMVAACAVACCSAVASVC